MMSDRPVHRCPARLRCSYRSMPVQGLSAGLKCEPVTKEPHYDAERTTEEINATVLTCWTDAPISRYLLSSVLIDDGGLCRVERDGWLVRAMEQKLRCWRRRRTTGPTKSHRLAGQQRKGTVVRKGFEPRLHPCQPCTPIAQ
ncbi:hypothetical protein MHYP_G00317610 [Metynnis hypsauchen]